MTTTAAAIASSSSCYCYCSSSFCPSYSSYKLNILTTTNRSNLSIPESKKSSPSISSLSSSFVGGGGGGPRQIRQYQQQQQQQQQGRLRLLVSCQVALNNSIEEVSSKEEDEDEEMKKAQDKIGSRVRVKVPLKVYHVPKIPELDLTGMEGELKQYVGLWKGKRISANFPFKIQFFTPVKFFAHLKEDEFDYIITQDPPPPPPPTTTTM